MLNQKGLKLNGDMICGLSYDEIWSHPKAFLEGKTIKWDLPALDLDSKEAEKLIREKVNIYAKRFDGLRIDAAWTYVEPLNKDYGDKIFNIIVMLMFYQHQQKQHQRNDNSFAIRTHSLTSAEK